MRDFKDASGTKRVEYTLTNSALYRQGFRFGTGSLACLELKVRDVIRLIRNEGWYQIVQEGSHRQFKHPRLPGRVTIAGHLSDDLPPRTLRSILKQARLGWMR